MPDFQVIFMDAGQGDCTLIVYPDGSLTLVDCGSTKSGSAAFEQILVVLDRFVPANKNTINNLVLTHPDEDHYNQLVNLSGNRPAWKIGQQVYFGGAVELYENARESNFTSKFLSARVLNGTARSPNSFNTAPDLYLSRAGVNVTIVAANCTGHLSATNGKKKNTNSIVLMVEYGPGKLFLMGDAFVSTEKFILENVKKKGLPKLSPAPTQDCILKMGHHGSDTSTGPDWLKAISPNVLVVSSGTKSFGGKGMPTEAKINATKAACAALGTLTFQTSYVVFDETQRGVAGKDYKMIGPTNQCVWSMCFQVKWTKPKSGQGFWFESGQTWYYGVNAGKASYQAWYGCTGS